MKVQSNALTLHSKCQHKIFVAHPECNAIEIKHRNQRIIFFYKVQSLFVIVLSLV